MDWALTEVCLYEKKKKPNKSDKKDFNMYINSKRYKWLLVSLLYYWGAVLVIQIMNMPKHDDEFWLLAQN